MDNAALNGIPTLADLVDGDNKMTLAWLKYIQQLYNRGNSYSLTKFTAASTQNVKHNFGTYPVVQVINGSGTVISPTSIVNNTLNDFTVTFAAPTTGNIIAVI